MTGRSTMRMTRKRFIGAGIIVLLVAIVGIGSRPSRKPVAVETASARFLIISARYMVGTNLTFDQDPPMKALYRRIRKKLNRPMRGFPGDLPLPDDGVKVHSIAVLCEGQVLPTQVSNVGREIDAECTDVAGRVLGARA